MSFECMAWAIKQKAGSVYAKAVLMHLANCTNKDTGMCRPRIKMIAVECEMSETAVKTSLKVLEDAGLVERIPRFSEDKIQLSNDYKLLLSPVTSGNVREGTGVGRDPTHGVGSAGGVGRDPAPGGSGSDPGVGRQPPPVETGSIETGIEPGFDVVEIWNLAVLGTNLPKARMTPQRASIVKNRLKVKGWAEDFKAACKHVTNSKWHRGENDTQWVANIDFLLQAGKATQLAERATATPAAKADKWNGIGDKDYNEGTEGLQPVEGAGDVAKYF